MTAARWAAVWALAYNVLHHLGALPGGLGDAGGGTRWVDWITLLTPYAVVGSAFAALRAAAADRRGWTIALVGAAMYVQGHGINVAANSISNARGGAPPTHLWDEVVGHWLWYAGVALLVVALAHAVDAAARPAALVLAVASGMTWTTNALEGTTAVGSLAVAVALAGWGWRRRTEGSGRLLLAAFGTSAVLLMAYGVWHMGFPAPSQLDGQALHAPDVQEGSRSPGCPPRRPVDYPSGPLLEMATLECSTQLLTTPSCPVLVLV